jgi:3-phenylpropionate/trans-cinnamate dioxygenase ferredoxin reductase subunit
VVGAGFIGAEVAATCRKRGLDVTIVEPLASPMARVLAPEIGAVCAAAHRDAGVDCGSASASARCSAAIASSA